MFHDRVRRVAVLLLVIAAGPFMTSCTAAAPPDQTSAAERLRSDLTEYLADPDLSDVQAVIVMANDRTLFEEYSESAPEDYHNVFSVTKSVVSTLVGIAVDEGLLRVDLTVAELLPASAATMSPAVGATTLEQLLTMTGGFPDTWRGDDSALFAQSDWVAYCLQSQTRPAGQGFAYSDQGAHLVAAILVQATGRSVLQYAREKLFGPLDIDTEPAAEPTAVASNLDAYEAAAFAWPVDPQGIHLGPTLLKLRPRDMAALGSLYLHEGRWDGEQVVSAAWLRTATAAHTPAFGSADDYGYLWWVGTADGSPAYLAWGYGGQLIEVVPARKLVVVVSTALSVVGREVVHPSSLTSMVDQIIAPALG
jgi:CubicO group peptidase (beta-lactamase class C family)